MARPKKENTHDCYTVLDRKVEKTEASFEGDEIQILIPKGTPYVKVRRALETALLRVR